ncbi:secC motif containing protein [Bacillus lacus]|uniref:SecC motif containing protein n=1 Tax=Metabacillus lacus TaxID=1983721 RepID=A0A7X2IZP9_9BACI|nr:SEC-C metal-binding domain-containing protein [Metabacillus lacus]MRX72780.1 secC motif containing protein [Metabacillus lacus]
MTINSNDRDKAKGIASLKEGLSRLRMADLHDIRKRLQIKNVSSLKKAELIQHLCENFPSHVKFAVSQFDERRLFLLKNLLANEGVISAKNIEIEEMEYFPKTGFIYTGSYQGKPIVMIPQELLPSLGEVIQDQGVLAEVKRNTEWIKITRGLLYYYGTVPHEKLIELVEKYSPIHPDFQAYHSVISEAMEYYHEMYVDEYGFSYWEVMNPMNILEEQESRGDLDYYPFSKKQLLEAGKTDYVERPKGSSQLLSLLTQKYRLPKKEAIELLDTCIIQTKMGDMPSRIFQLLQTQLIFDSLDDVQKLTDVVVPLMNHTREWYLKGYAPTELSRRDKKELMPLPDKKGEVISLQSRQKVGRNDPCPCGSGKKFKKCCGN